jgi:glycosyltransferase involved in cell wall biosynthesis
MAAALQQEYGAIADKISVIHNFSGASRPTLPQKQPFILAAGRVWDPAKNLRLLEQVASRVTWQIHVAGHDRSPDDSSATAESVVFLGPLPRSELLERMEAASIFAHPALYEPFGLSVLEAARAGCCLVLADIPSLRELWEGAAVFIDPRDPDRWAFELENLIADASKREALGSLAGSHSENYRGSVAIESYWNLYRSLLNSSNQAKKEAAA